MALLGGAVAAWPLTARAQQPERMRRIGVLMGFEQDDPEGKVWLSGFTEGLQKLGWSDGRSMRMDVRWTGSNFDLMRRFARGVVGLQPDAILAHGTRVTKILQRETQTIPVVFLLVADPVGLGFVASYAHPGGNLTGFMYADAAIVGKWLELLTETAPGVKRAAIMFNPDTAAGGGSFYLPSFQAAARSLKVEQITVPVHSDAEIETGITSLGREPGGGLVAMGDPFMLAHRAPTILAAARNKVPAVYFAPVFPRDGGLLSYGPDPGDMFRRAAPYVDRILRGAKPAELPVQAPTKFELAINLKVAKALGLTFPPFLLDSADEVIE
ncbi:MAG: ABC transporter substrate-binding protein [Alphaproteobacteria bacterium]